VLVPLVVLVVLGALTGGLLSVPSVRATLLGVEAAPSPAASASAPAPSASPSATRPPSGERARPAAPAPPPDPFAGTPAATFSRGAAGIVLPPAKPLGVWTAAEVRATLLRTRDLLVASRLDPRVVQRGDTSRYLALLSPSTRRLVTAAVRKGEPGLGYVTRLAPGSVLAPQPVRVKGSMSVALGRDGQLVVVANYVWVYPLRRAGAPSAAPTPAAVVPGATLVVLHSAEVWEVYPPDGISVEDQGLRPGTASTFTFNMDCTLVKRGLLALPSGSQAGPQRVATEQAYDPARPPSSLPSTCR